MATGEPESHHEHRPATAPSHVTSTRPVCGQWNTECPAGYLYRCCAEGYRRGSDVCHSASWQIHGTLRRSLTLLRLGLSTGAHAKEITLWGTLEGKQDQLNLSRTPVARMGGAVTPWYPAAAQQSTVTFQPHLGTSHVPERIKRVFMTSPHCFETLWGLFPTAQDGQHAGVTGCRDLLSDCCHLSSSLHKAGRKGANPTANMSCIASPSPSQ